MRVAWFLLLIPLNACGGAPCPTAAVSDVVPNTDNDPDGDGVVDDACPRAAEDLDGYADDDGCPELDNDGDRILDRCDRCPLVPESYNGHEDDDGCPESVVLSSSRHIALQPIYFLNSATDITVPHLAILQELAEFVRRTPLRVVVEGHSSDGEPYPIRVAEERANMVRDALVQLGVSIEQITTVGRGRDRMVHPGPRNREERAANRRVTFLIEGQRGDDVERVPPTHDRDLMPDAPQCPE